MSARDRVGKKAWPGLPTPTLIDDILADLHRVFAAEHGGAPAAYIPELAKANPDHFGIAIVTADGASYTVGDWQVPFTIQSISKPFVFGLALEDHGRDAVLRKVGVEPSGDAFNSIVFDQRANRPFNPMVNAGAIATAALVRGDDVAGRLGRVLDMFGRYIGRRVEIDPAVYASEKATGHRNRAIAHLELNFGMIDAPVDDHLDVYFQQCSALVTCHDLAVMAATLANGGVNPLTGERAIASHHVKNVIAVMNSCGMYDYSGEWSYRIGLPAKSGVGGGIIAVLPGRLGIGVFSPPLDARGNSLRGIKVCEALSERFGLNMFDVALNPAPAVRRRRDGVAVRSKRARSAEETAVLDRAGRRIHVLELRGDVTFIALEQVTRAIAALPPDTDHVIVDLGRVTQMDPAGAALLHDLATRLAGEGKVLRLASVGGGLAAALPATMPAAFPDLDHALEWAEDALLATAQGPRVATELPLAAMELAAGLTAEQQDQLAAILDRRVYAAGTVIVCEGDPADALYFLAQGTVNVFITTEGDAARRLNSLPAGKAFGEMALLDGGRRSASVAAESDVVVLALPLGRLMMLAQPEIRLALTLNLARNLSHRLRQANAEIASLA